MYQTYSCLILYPKYPEKCPKIPQKQKMKQILSIAHEICHMPQNITMTPNDLEGSNFKPF